MKASIDIKMATQDVLQHPGVQMAMPNNQQTTFAAELAKKMNETGHGVGQMPGGVVSAGVI